MYLPLGKKLPLFSSSSGHHPHLQAEGKFIWVLGTSTQRPPRLGIGSCAAGSEFLTTKESQPEEHLTSVLGIFPSWRAQWHLPGINPNPTVLALSWAVLLLLATGHHPALLNDRNYQDQGRNHCLTHQTSQGTLKPDSGC